MNHKWDKSSPINTCTRCKIMRERRTIKRSMAITNSPPYNHYQYETRWVYISGDAPSSPSRPNCSNGLHWRKGDSDYEVCPNCGAGRKVVFEAGQKGLADCADCGDEFVALYTKPELQQIGVPIPD